MSILPASPPEGGKIVYHSPIEDFGLSIMGGTLSYLGLPVSLEILLISFTVEKKSEALDNSKSFAEYHTASQWGPELKVYLTPRTRKRILSVESK